MPNDSNTHTIGGFDRAGQAWVLGLFGFGGLAVGVVFPYAAAWVADLPWVPFQGPLELLSSFDQAWLTWGRPLLGLAAGLGFALWVLVDTPVLTVSRESIEVRRRGGVERVIDRSTVDSVRPKGSRTIIENSHGRVLFDGDVEGGKDAIREAFIHHGYPWEGPRP